MSKLMPESDANPGPPFWLEMEIPKADCQVLEEKMTSSQHPDTF